MWWAVATFAVLLLFAANCCRRFLIVTVTGVSMLPTLTPGDRLLVRRTRLRQVQVGQLAVVHRPDPAGQHAATTHRPARTGDFIIKRVAAVPGNPVPAACRSGSAATPALVPDATFIILGDNPDRSYDSRHAGLIAGGLLVGVVVRRITVSR